MYSKCNTYNSVPDRRNPIIGRGCTQLTIQAFTLSISFIALTQFFCFSTQVTEIVGFGDLGDLVSLLYFIYFNAQSLYLLAQALFTWRAIF